MTKLQVCLVIPGAALLAYAGFDGTRDYGIFWQLVGAVIGAITGAIGGFLLWLYLAGNWSSDE